MKNETTDTAQGIHSPLTTSTERRFINHTGTAISFTPTSARSHFIHSPEKYAELNGFGFENTVDNEGNIVRRLFKKI